MYSYDDFFIRYGLSLMNVDGVGCVNARKIFSKYPNLYELFQNRSSPHFECEGVSKIIFERIKNFNDFNKIDNEIEFLKKKNISVLSISDEMYPFNLKQCYDAPFMLFSKGNVNFNNNKIISFVGSRNITSYGVGFIKELMQEIAKYKPIIVSGFAFGVDINSHLAAIDNDLQTIAVLGQGLDQIYPKSHKKYYDLILQNGGFVSEFTSYDLFKKENFIKRNRIVAGLSSATLVIESAIKGGSLSTAKFANDYNRDVFALPGRNSDLYSAGCNHLIKTNQANLLTSVDDLVYYLNWDKNIQKMQKVKVFEVPNDLTTEELKVILFLKENGSEILDIIAQQTDIPVYKLSVVLLNLELRNLVVPLPGKLYDLKK